MTQDRRPTSCLVTDDTLAICTDLYQLTMMAAYWANGVKDTGVFELFTRKLPSNRNFLVIAGLEQALHYLEALRFTSDEISYLRGLPAFKGVAPGFFDFLAGFRFSGDVYAMPEGTVAFANEPLLRVSAPMAEAQLVETYLLATLNFQTLVASKAARVVMAARGRPVAEFGSRRAHGFQAGALAARASYVAGCASTSNVLAGRRCGIPVTGTAAHSFTMVFPRELDAFRAYYRVFPDNCILLLDTYDTIEGARNAVRTAKNIKAVRLDSGDLDTLSRRVRAILDEAGMERVKIVASGDLNEHKIDKLLRNGAPIDLFGVGTEMATSRDAPSLNGVYKLVEIRQGGRGVPKIKLSADKATYPHAKQVYRQQDVAGRFARDVIGLYEEDIEGEPLLQQVVKDGQRCYDLPPLEASRERALRQIERLPEPLKQIEAEAEYDVQWSPGLECARRDLIEREPYKDASG